MNYLYWIVFGLITGTIANYLSPNWNGGIVGSVILGIVGAVVGGYIGGRFFGVSVTGFNLMSFVVAVAGSLFVLFVSRVVARN